MKIDYDELSTRHENDILADIGNKTIETIASDTDVADELGLGASSARDVGEAIFRRWNRELHSLICGTEAPDEDGEKLKKMLSLDSAGMAAALTGLLIMYFSVNPAVAPLIAVLVVKKLVTPAGEEICSVWASRLK